MANPVVLEHIDPRTLLVDLNLPGRDTADKNLTASIRAFGVLQPVLVVADEAAGTEAAVKRIIAQYDGNTHRQGLRTVQEAAVVGQLSRPWPLRRLGAKANPDAKGEDRGGQGGPGLAAGSRGCRQVRSDTRPGGRPSRVRRARG